MTQLRKELRKLSEDTNSYQDMIEGNPKLTEHTEYERKSINWQQAINLHGTICRVCGFDFDKFYGSQK